MITKIVIDIDGTLIDTSESDKEVFREIYENASANTGKSVGKLKKGVKQYFSLPFLRMVQLE